MKAIRQPRIGSIQGMAMATNVAAGQGWDVLKVLVEEEGTANRCASLLGLWAARNQCLVLADPAGPSQAHLRDVPFGNSRACRCFTKLVWRE